MVFSIRKSIDIVSPHNNQRYSSIKEYEKALQNDGCDIWTDKQFKETREKLLDQSLSKPKSKPEEFNHIHIDFNNGRIEKSNIEHKDYNSK